MTLDASFLLPTEQLTKSRTPAELAAWVLERCEAIAEVTDSRKPALMHHRPFKEFYEEIYPLSLFATHCYGTRDDVLITPNLDNRPFDAIIRDHSVSPPSDLLVEITSARDPQEHLRMEYLVEHGHVMLWSTLTVSGNKHARHIHIEPDAVEHRELVARYCGWIRTAAEGKASRGDRYGRSHVLVIAFEDGFKPADNDLVTMRTFVNEQILVLPLNFSALYLVGMSGKTYLPFPLDQTGEAL
jgi:hypothetical protein